MKIVGDTPNLQYPGMLGILWNYRYLLYFKRYDIIILHNSVFHMLLFRASQIAAHPVNVTTEQVNNMMG